MANQSNIVHLREFEISISESSSSEISRSTFGSGGGGPAVDSETKNYLDANMRAVKAENSASFARLEAKIDGIPRPPSIWQIVVALAATLASAFGILAFASDRFDSGISSMGVMEEAIELQRETNAAQDERLDRILKALEEAK